MKNAPSPQIATISDSPRTQYGAICWRLRDGHIEVLLITSRDTGRWIIPKGWPIKGLSPEASAAQEAFEEAGVEGTTSPDCIGIYPYDKVLGKNVGSGDTPAQNVETMPCIVAVYPLQVSRLCKRYPESAQRRRKWFTPQKAATKVAEPELQSLLAGFNV